MGSVCFSWRRLGAMGFGNGVVFQVVSNGFQSRLGLASAYWRSRRIGGFLLPLWLGGSKI